ncbi:MAG: DUF4857 domain-containing protein [Bacteroidales bacterium]|jgi:hypothetical protein|nr:DUF4857 domain-containing protein [Bacteroidales bacterium]
MTKLSRYILVITAILSTSIVLPELYWMAFDKPIKTPYVQYSCMINDFMIRNVDEGTFTDDQGNAYTRAEYESSLPLMYSRQLIINEQFPDTLLGVNIDLRAFTKARSYTKIYPADLNTPLSQLYPLFESESGRAKLVFPDDFFRITWRMEFITANTNTIDEEKSRMFSAALYQKGFQFPAKFIAGIPTVLKKSDEGYLLIDKDEQLYHIKSIKGLPFVKRVDLTKGLKFKYIHCVDSKEKLFYAYLIAQDNSIYTLTQDNYKLVRWPIEDYIAEEHELKIQGDYFNYNLTLLSDKMQKTYALNRNIKVVDMYEYKWVPKRERSVGKISASLFPFEFSLTHPNSNFIKLYPTLPKGYVWILINLLFVGIQLIIIRKRQTKLFNQILDLLIVTVTGIFGFIAVNIFPNKID